MEELENGKTRAYEETQEIEPKTTPYGIYDKENEIPEENEDVKKGNDYIEPLLAATSYSGEQMNDTTNEVVIESEAEPELGKTSQVSIFPVDETRETILLDNSDVNIGEGNIPRSEISRKFQDNHNAPVDTEDRETEHPPISANPSLAQRTTWGGCCGLFQFLRRSDE